MPVAAVCRYELKQVRAAECQAIKKSQGAWTYVDKPQDGSEFMAHLYCACQTELTTSDSSCDAKQTRRLTLSEPSDNIQVTCAKAQDLCTKACGQLLRQAPVRR